MSAPLRDHRGIGQALQARVARRDRGVSVGHTHHWLAEVALLVTHGVVHGTFEAPVEPEIAFVTKRALKGPGCHIGAVLAATDFVIPGIEVIDSRYRDFKFDLKSVVADNTSASRFVVGGQALPADEVDLRTLGIVLEKNGQAVAFGAGAAVLGHPAAAIAMLANHLGARDQEIPAGTLVLSGGITEAVAVQAGDAVTLRVQGMGSVGLRFV
jgi:2-oxo-3-hexenedioate decarboxylase